MSLESILKAYREDSQKKRSLVRKADMTKGRLVFVVEALRTILADDHFRTLLKAEQLDTLPKALSERLAVQNGV
jgi:ParB family chromosome partitioning protein